MPPIAAVEKSIQYSIFSEVSNQGTGRVMRKKGSIMDERVVRGPYFDELSMGAVFDSTPPVTLTDGLMAGHHAIVGERLWLVRSHEFAKEVLGGGPLASPALVWNVAIGQSSEATQLVRANLYYRGLRFHRLPLAGDTLRTRTEVAGLKWNSRRLDRPLTGLVTLRVTTVDQHGETVLDFHRCAMLPVRDKAMPPRPPIAPTHEPVVRDQDVDVVAAGLRIPRMARLPEPGTVLRVAGRDLVSAAPELARLTLNLAAVHHDAAAADGRRLVFGGHTIGIALAQANRALPNLLTVVAWHSCDHLAPVHEGDMLTSTVEVERARLLPNGCGHLVLRSRVDRHDDGSAPVRVLDWRYVALAM